jgi:murein DD-endopeptidase MepM/ murein hydrolase activator NlpD
MKCRYPFPENVKFEAVEPKGDFAHENFPESMYAKDFVLPLEAPVLAVKKGIVILSRYDSDVHFSTTEVEPLSIDERIDLATKYTNLVGIDHKDGTLTEYAHLAKRRAVSEGQNVEEGELIGYVGLSGITDLPHLHFNAFKIENGKGISIPVEFIE